MWGRHSFVRPRDKFVRRRMDKFLDGFARPAWRFEFCHQVFGQLEVRKRARVGPANCRGTAGKVSWGGCLSRKSHPRGFAPEGESGQHHMRCLPSSICLRCSSRICSNRGGSWKSRTSFFVTSSTSPSGVHRAVCGCVGATGRCWYGCHGFGQACLGRPGSFSLTRYCGGIEQDFAPIGAGNPALGQGGLRLAVSCANSSIG